MAILFYDVESTGIPAFDRHSDFKGQPRIVELAAILTDDDNTELASMSVIVKPDGWAIGEDTEKIHGISNEQAARYGISIKAAMGAFIPLWKAADLRVGHSERFDRKMVGIEVIRLWGAEAKDKWKAGASFCTMNENRAAVDARTAEGKKKPPTLAETYKFYTGKDFDDGHGALNDAMACREIYFSMRPIGGINPQPKAEPADDLMA